MQDRFRTFADSVEAPARRVAVVTPNDTADLGEVGKALYVGTGGDLAVIAADAIADAAVVFRNLPSGALLPVRVRRVAATGTTAADLVVLL